MLLLYSLGKLKIDWCKLDSDTKKVITTTIVKIIDGTHVYRTTNTLLGMCGMNIKKYDINNELRIKIQESLNILLPKMSDKTIESLLRP